LCPGKANATAKRKAFASVFLFSKTAGISRKKGKKRKMSGAFCNLFGSAPATSAELPKTCEKNFCGGLCAGAARGGFQGSFKVFSRFPARGFPWPAGLAESEKLQSEIDFGGES